MATTARQEQIEGVDVAVDAVGKRKAVLIDLGRHGELWEDCYDTLLSWEHAQEPRESLGVVRQKLLDEAPQPGNP
jgi:hypothetical protein